MTGAPCGAQSLPELERIDRTARAQISAARADGVPIPANVFGGPSSGDAGGFVPQWQQQQIGFRVDRHEPPSNIGSVSRWNNAQPGASAMPGATRTVPQLPGGTVPYTQQRRRGPTVRIEKEISVNNRTVFLGIVLVALLSAATTSQARWMNPQTGRFHTMDTYDGDNRNPPSLHKYVYAENNPINNTDPSGHEVEEQLTITEVVATLASPKMSGVSPGRLRPSRPLTAGEVDLGRSVFGSKINYSTPKVVNGPWIAQGLFTAVTPNGNIYARGDGTAAGGIYRKDYSIDPDVGIRGVFVHEMTHVWQYQNGFHVVTGAAFDRNYDYDHSKLGTKDFKTYGIEQEAHIVEDLYLVRSGAPIYENNYSTVVPNPPPLQTYVKVTSPYFP